MSIRHVNYDTHLGFLNDSNFETRSNLKSNQKSNPKSNPKNFCLSISSAGCCGFNTGRVCTPIKREKVNVYAAVIRVKRSCDDASCSAEIDKDNLRKVSSWTPKFGKLLNFTIRLSSESHQKLNQFNFWNFQILNLVKKTKSKLTNYFRSRLDVPPNRCSRSTVTKNVPASASWTPRTATRTRTTTIATASACVRTARACETVANRTPRRSGATRIASANAARCSPAQRVSCSRTERAAVQGRVGRGAVEVMAPNWVQRCGSFENDEALIGAYWPLRKVA